MVEQLRSFASEVTRVAARSAPKGASRAGRRAGRRRNLERPHGLGERDGTNLTAQVRNIAEVTTAVARGDLSRKITVDVKGEILRAEEHHQYDGRPAPRVRQ